MESKTRFWLWVISLLSIAIFICVANIKAANECAVIAKEEYNSDEVSCEYFNGESGQPCKCNLYNCIGKSCEFTEEIRFRIKSRSTLELEGE